MAKISSEQEIEVHCYMTKVFRDHGLLQKDVADKMGCKSKMSICNYKKNPSVKILQRMADAIGADIIEFFTPLHVDDPLLKPILHKH